MSNLIYLFSILVLMIKLSLSYFELVDITLLRICDAPGGAVVEREPEFGMTLEIL